MMFDRPRSAIDIPSTHTNSLTFSATTENDTQFPFPQPNPLKSFIHRRQNSQERGQKRSHSSRDSITARVVGISHEADLSNDFYEDDVQEPISKRPRSPKTVMGSSPPDRADIPFRPSSEPSLPQQRERERSQTYKKINSPELAPSRGIDDSAELSFTGSITEEQLRQMNEGAGLDDDDDDADDTKYEEEAESDYGYGAAEAAGMENADLTSHSQLSTSTTEQNDSTFATPAKPASSTNLRASHLTYPMAGSRPQRNQEFPFTLRNPRPTAATTYDDTYPSDTTSNLNSSLTLSDILSLETSTPSSLNKRVQFFRNCTYEQWATYGEELSKRQTEVMKQMIEARENRAKIMARFERELDEKGIDLDDKFQKSRAYMARLRSSFGLLL